MFLRGDFWHYDFVIGGIRYRGSTGFKKNEKDKARAEEERLRVQAREKHSVEMVWEQTKKRMISSSNLEFDEEKVWKTFAALHSSAGADKMTIYHGYWRNIYAFLHERHPEIRMISDITNIHAIEWYGELRKRDLSNSSRNSYLTLAKMLFNTLGKTYGIIENPFAELKPLPKDSVTRDAYTPEELKKIGAYAEGWVYSICLTAISTGLRKGDICMLKKESVDMENRILSVKTRKTGVNVEIPILPGLYRHFQEMFLAHPDSPYVFPELAEMYQNKRHHVITNGVKGLLHKVGIEETEKTIEGYAHKVSTKDIHSFRHTFVYMASVSGIPLPVVQSIVGHLNPEMTKHYMDHAGRDARLAYMRQLPGYITGGEAPKEINIVDEIEKGNEKRDIKQRILDLINRTSKENFERTKARILKILV